MSPLLKEVLLMITLFSASHRHLVLGGVLCLAILSFTPRHLGQSNVASNEDLVSVQSWKRGNRSLQARAIELSLSSSYQYEWDLYSVSKDPLFRLRLRLVNRSTLRGANFSCWSADLREITTERTSGATLLGPYLLNSEGPGRGDYFPNDDWAAFICPLDNPSKILDGPMYPIKTTRRFMIEGFSLELRVTDYRLDKRGNFDELRLRIEVSASSSSG